MQYPYSKINLIENSQNYMYAPFYGNKLLSLFINKRLSVIKSCNGKYFLKNNYDNLFISDSFSIIENNFGRLSNELLLNFQKLLDSNKNFISKNISQYKKNISNKSLLLNSISKIDQIKTLDLLYELINNQLIEKNNKNLKTWIDLLVKKYEVTKKIYELYYPQLSKGIGSYKRVRLYWLFSLCLCLYYLKTKKIKYLNTLIKLCDLLCSVSLNRLFKEISNCGLKLVLATELCFILMLSNKNGVKFEIK